MKNNINLVLLGYKVLWPSALIVACQKIIKKLNRNTSKHVILTSFTCEANSSLAWVFFCFFCFLISLHDALAWPVYWAFADIWASRWCSCMNDRNSRCIFPDIFRGHFVAIPAVGSVLLPLASLCIFSTRSIAIRAFDFVKHRIA